jgi:hypothetical protein
MPRRAASTAPAKDPNGCTVAGGAQHVLFDSAFGLASRGLRVAASSLQRVRRRAARARRPRRTARRFMRQSEKGQRFYAGHVRVPPNAQTKSDRTRREQPSEIGSLEGAKKSPEIR